MRIQILELPSKSVGQAHETPYAVIVSEIPIIDDDDPSLRSDAPSAAEWWEQKLLDGGAQFALFTSETVELGPAPESRIVLGFDGSKPAHLVGSFPDGDVVG